MNSNLVQVIALALAFCGGVAAQEAPRPDAADKVFAAIINAVTSGSSSRIVAYIPDGATARFDLKNIVAADLKADKAPAKLDAWFKAGAKGAGWKKLKRTDKGNPVCVYHRKIDGRRLTITLKKIKDKYYLSSLVERG